MNSISYCLRLYNALRNIGVRPARAWRAAFNV